MKTTLVSLISDQTIPNVQLIKEKKADSYLFITTVGMQKKGVLDWIITATGLQNKEILEPIIVNAFSYDDVYSKIEASIDDETHYIVNLTGGTKIMTLAVSDLFKTVNSELYYLTGSSNYLKLFPGRTKPTVNLETKITLKEYLLAYGFKISKSDEPFGDLEKATPIFNYYLNDLNLEKDAKALLFLLPKRNKNVELNDELIYVSEFLSRIGFKPTVSGKLNKKETKYLTGDWFEEYMYFQLIKQLKIDKEMIGTGWIINKGDIPNEFDILYVSNNVLNIVECKTSIWIDVEEKKSIIAETMYKADSLRDKLGLFAKTSIVTLSNIDNARLKEVLNRADANNINVFGKKSFEDPTDFYKNF